MSRMWERITNNPALLIGAAEAVLALAVAFGVDLTQEQMGAVLAAIVAVGALATRQTVYGPKTVDKVMDAESVIAAAERRTPRG